MREFVDSNWWALSVGAIAQLVLFTRWFYRRIRNEEVNRAFVKDMALHHLPHIYELLLKLAEKQGIELPVPPQIQWIDLNGHQK
jgi:hypothetical protein